MKIQLKRSVVLEDYGQGDEAKRPEAEQMLDGELAVNYNSNDPAIFLKDSTGTIIRIAGNNSIGGDQTLTYTADADNAGKLSISDGNTVYIPIATDSVAGLFTGAEKQKLAGISAGATVDQNLGYTSNNDLAGTVTITNGTNATIPIAAYTDDTSIAGLFTGAEKKKLAGLNTNADNNLHFVQVAGDKMTGTLTIDNTTANANALVTGDGHDIVLGALANIVFDNDKDTTVQANTLAGDDVIATLPATSGTLTTEPTSDGVYLRKLKGTALTWVSVSDDTDGVVTSVNAGDGIDVNVTDPNAPVISVDLAKNQGLEIQSTELAVIAGNNAQDTLLWTVTGGAATITSAGASGKTTEPEGTYVGVTTTADAGGGCTVNFDVAADGTISNLTIANPGSGYGESEVLTIVGHQTAAPAAITFTLETDANSGRYDYTGWRTGALTTGGAAGSGGDLTGVEGGPGIEIDESDTTTPKVSIDLATNPGLEFSTTGDAGKLQVKDHHGITVDSNGVSVDGHNGITVNTDGVSVDAHNGITVGSDGVSVTASSGIEVDSNGVSTRIHTGGALSDQLGGNTNELGLADPTVAGTSNQVVVWKAENSANTIALAAAPNNVSDQPEADYVNVATTVDSGAGSGLTVNFTVDAVGAISNLTISNPGSGYDEKTPVCSVDGHGNLDVTITDKYATAQWIAEPFSGGGGGGGGGDVTGVDAGDGIDVSTGGGPEPVVSVDVHANGGLTNRFDSTAPADAGELGITPGSNSNDIVVWREEESVQTISVANVSDQPNGTYVAIPTASTGGGTGLTVTFTITDGLGTISNLTVANPGTGYSVSDTATIDGHSGPTVTITGVYSADQWDVISAETITSGTSAVSQINAGDGIAVTNGNGVSPTISADVDADGGITNDFNSTGDIGITPGTTAGDIMVWRGAGAVVDLDGINLTGALPPSGTYTDIQTTGGSGTGLTVGFTIPSPAGLPASITVINPGSGYSDDDAIDINGTDLNCDVNGVTAAARWQPGSLTSSVNADGSAGHWTRDDGTDTLSPVLDNDNVDIGTGTFTGQTLALESNNGTNTINHAAADGLTSDVTYTWPTVGTVGQVLSTDTSGTLSWTDHVIVQDGSVLVPAVTNYSQGQLWWNSDANVSKLFVLYDDPENGESTTEAGGLKWIEASPKPQIPSIFPDLGDNTPQVGTLDDRYLRVDALPLGNNNQTVQSTGTTKFNGLVEAGNGVNVTGGSDATVGDGLCSETSGLLRISTAGQSVIRIQSDGTKEQISFGDAESADRNYAFSFKANPLNKFSGVNNSFIGARSILSSTDQRASLITCSIEGDAASLTNLLYFSVPSPTLNISGNIRSEIKCYEAPNFVDRAKTTYGFYSDNSSGNESNFNFFASGTAPNFFKGDTHIGGTAAHNTRGLWESTLTEEQKEQLTAGTLAIPTNVATPGDGEFVRQWWYNQQSAEDQALIDSGELEYPSHFQAANFVDTFDLGVTTNIDLLEDGQAKFKTNVFIEGTIPSLVLDNTAAAGDYKRWRFTADKDGKLFFQAINDGGAGSGNLFQMQRTGNSVDTFDAVKDGNVWFSINNVNQTLDCNGRAEFAAGVSVTGGWPAGVVNGMGFDSGRAVRLIANSESIITLNEDNSYKLGLSPSITGDGSGSYGYGVVFAPTVTGEYKAEINLMRTQPTLAGAKTPTLNYYSVTNISSPPTEVENVSGFNVSDTIAFGTKTNFGFSSGLSENGTKSFNFYAGGTAPNYFRGELKIFSPIIAGTDGYNAGNSPDAKDAYFNAKATSGLSGVAVYGDYADGNTLDVIKLYKYPSYTPNVSPNLHGKIRVNDAGGIEVVSEDGESPVFIVNSDARVKTLTPFTVNAADVVSQLNPGVNGFLAHELQAQVSDAVTGTQDATEAIGTLADYDGTVLQTEVTEPAAEELEYTEETTDEYGVSTQSIRTRTWTATGTRPVYQGVDQTKLIPLLTKALQEALTEIDTLKGRLDILEGN